MARSTLLIFLLAQVLYHIEAADSNNSTDASTFASNIPSCAMSCLSDGAAQSTCGGMSHVSCLCTNSDFQSFLSACLQKSCDASTTSAASTYTRSLCASVGIQMAGTAGSSAGSRARSPAPPRAFIPSLWEMTLIGVLTSAAYTFFV
ncbi:hypothetical protein CROQUDRAFT_60161 [Cronartium quercuum f. sp. fusiforme G11]|uniref:CFEM domain-containing protein n=1 Tax=Cronartium quercuum f. sp. fusiforme G11 TaxID=708437 RepID=A0A9P6TDY7_9BASI|nr:hypothetical protein CROQUDRAFT_60161 [Cronartium quercuum f. sp. fusiforme G11]